MSDILVPANSGLRVLILIRCQQACPFHGEYKTKKGDCPLFGSNITGSAHTNFDREFVLSLVSVMVAYAVITSW